MRGRGMLATGLVLTLMSLGIGGAEATSKQGQEDNSEGAEHLTFYSEEVSSVTVTRTGEVFEGEEQEEFQPAAGDRFIIVEKLYSDEARDDEVGRNDIACTVTESSGEFPEGEPAPGDEFDFLLRFVCEGVIYLDDDGTLTWQGAAEFSDETFEAEDEPFITVAITGGTEKFVRAGGQVEISDVSADEEDAAVLSRYDVELYDLKARG